MTTLGNRSQQMPGAVFRIGGSHAKKAWIWAERSFGLLKCNRGTRSSCSVEVLLADVVFADVVIISLFIKRLPWLVCLLCHALDPVERLFIMHPHNGCLLIGSRRSFGPNTRL